MKKAVAARTIGDDYQALFFWLQACRLFEADTKVTQVEIEADNVRSFDDVVVRYSDGILENGTPVASECYQVKFHVTKNGAFTWAGMMDPAFINAESVSLLKRLRTAQLEYAPGGTGALFIMYSPWVIDPHDPLSRLISNTDGSIRWEYLAKGGPRSEMGKIRAAWREHLELESDDDLRATLAPLRIRQSPNRTELEDRLNDKLLIAGMEPVKKGSLLHPYEALARSSIQKGSTKFDRSAIEALCKSQGLWKEKSAPEPQGTSIGIRSFVRFAEYLQDETDAMLCLLRHFDGRRTRDSRDWNRVIFPEVEKFLRTNIRPGSNCSLHLAAHGSIAFLCGRLLDSKSGAGIAICQPVLRGRELWQFSDFSAGSGVPDWKVADQALGSAGTEVALFLSITHDINADALAYVKGRLPRVSRVIRCGIPEPGNLSVRNATHASFLAQRVSSILKQARGRREHSSRLHVFAAAPNSFMFFLGQLSLSFGKLTLYEYDFETSRRGAYFPSFKFPPIQRRTSFNSDTGKRS